MTWVQTITGAAFDLTAPRLTRDQLFTDVAGALAKINRFSGQTQLPISVAQHSVIMCDSAMLETGDPQLAVFCLVHDAHEAFLGDMTTPTRDAICQKAYARRETRSPLLAEAIRAEIKAVIDDLKSDIDRAIISAAGLSWNAFQASKDRIREYDIRALRTERDVFMTPSPIPWGDEVENARRLSLRRPLKSLSAFDAEFRFREALEQLLPEMTAPVAATA